VTRRVARALAGDLSVHRIRRQIDFAGPSDCPAINEDLFEKLLIQQWRERTRQLFSPQLHTSSEPVFESDKEPIVRLRLNFNYVPIHRYFPLMATAQSSPEGVLAAESPVFQQLLFMDHRPFLDQAQSPARELALDNIERAEVDRGFELAIAGVEVRARDR
jgi:hypothetical protein